MWIVTFDALKQLSHMSLGFEDEMYSQTFLLF